MSDIPKLATEDQLKSVADTFTELYNHQGKQIKSIESGIIDTIIPDSPAPTKRGQYVVTEPGIYVNFKDSNKQSISVTEEEFTSGAVYLIFNGSDSRKVVVPIEANGEIKKGDTRGVSGNAVNNKIDEFYTTTLNLLNKKEIQPGTYVVSSSTQKIVKTGAVNWISIRIPAESKTTYHLQGMMDFSGKDIDVVQFGDKEEFFLGALKGTDNYKTFTTPDNCENVYLRVENKIDIAHNPPSSIYYNTALMSIGSVDIPYVEYGAMLKSEKIGFVESSKVVGLQGEISNNPVVIGVKQDTDSLLAKYDRLFRFDGTSKSRLDKEYILNKDGDSLEIRLRLTGKWSSFNDSLGIIGKDSTSRNVIGFYNPTTIWVRTATLDLVFSDLLVNAYELHTYKFEIADGYLSLFIDGIFISKKVISESINLLNLGDAYTAKSKFDLQYVKINEVIKDLVKSENVQIILEEKNTIAPNENFPNCFYEYNPSDGNAGDRCIVYTKLKGSKDFYIGFYVYAFIDDNPIIFSNQIRLQGASIFQYKNGAMIQTPYSALVPSESEFTLLQNGKADHTGGVHGDEQFVNYSFMPNGKPIELGTKIDLTPCEYFSYIQTSNLHETANASTPNEPIEGHPIIATHFKRTTFSNSEYKTQNIVKFLKEIPVVRTYTGLVCMHKDFAETGGNEYGDFSELNEKNNSQKLNNPYSKTFYGNGRFGSCEITSELIAVQKPNNKFCQNEEPYKSSNQMWITDRVNDSKYYRLIGGTSGFITTEVNEIWSLECNVIFSK